VQESAEWRPRRRLEPERLALLAQQRLQASPQASPLQELEEQPEKQLEGQLLPLAKLRGPGEGREITV
jgi:hypothetical protein